MVCLNDPAADGEASALPTAAGLLAISLGNTMSRRIAIAFYLCAILAGCDQAAVSPNTTADKAPAQTTEQTGKEVLGAPAVEASRSAYEWSSSPNRAGWKTLSHNILAFRVSVPDDWKFGISGEGLRTVVILYPSAQNNGVISEYYENIEISAFLLPGSVNEVATKYYDSVTATGRSQQAIEPDMPDRTQYSVRADKRLRSTWVSKAGISIIEDIFLFQYPEGVRSLVIRRSQAMAPMRQDTHTAILNSFEDLS
jgi:hypothetical protein